MSRWYKGRQHVAVCIGVEGGVKMVNFGEHFNYCGGKCVSLNGEGRVGIATVCVCKWR